MANEKVNLAAILDGPREEFQLRPTDVPSPGPGEVLIKVARIALNQIDKRVALHAAFPLPYPAILGACVAGRVEAVGPGSQEKDLYARKAEDKLLGTVLRKSLIAAVISNAAAGASAATPSPETQQSVTTPASRSSSSSSLPRFAVGDRVAAYTSYYSRKDHKDNRFGAFQHYVLCNDRTVLKLNDSDNLSGAASIIASAPLAAVTLSQHVGVTLRVLNRSNTVVPRSVGEQQQQQQRELKLLCYGAATGIGGFVTRLATQCGQQVICTAKSANHEYIRRLGAHKVFDYTDTANVVQQLADEGPYDAIIDCISTQATIQLLNDAVQRYRAHEATATNNNNDTKVKDPPTIYTLLPVPAAPPTESSEQKEKSDITKASSGDNNDNSNNYNKSSSSNSSSGDKQRCVTKFMWLTAPFGMEEKNSFTRWLFWDVLQSHLDSGTLVATPPLLVKGGLGALREAMDRMGTVSAQKVVVSLDE